MSAQSAPAAAPPGRRRAQNALAKRPSKTPSKKRPAAQHPDPRSLLALSVLKVVWLYDPPQRQLHEAQLSVRFMCTSVTAGKGKVRWHTHTHTMMRMY